MTPEELLTVLPVLKDEAKLCRDENDVEGAIDILRSAIDLIDASGWWQNVEQSAAPASVEDRKLAWHLADCIGMLGGNFRRRKDYPSAIDAFKRGAEIERDERFKIPSSYNCVNLIAVTIEAKMPTAPEQAAHLHEAVAVLEREISDPDMGSESRRRDVWAWADLGQCKALLGDKSGALDAYSRFKALGLLPEIESSSRVLENILVGLRGVGDARVPIVAEALQFLKGGAPAAELREAK